MGEGERVWIEFGVGGKGRGKKKNDVKRGKRRCWDRGKRKGDWLMCVKMV